MIISMKVINVSGFTFDLKMNSRRKGHETSFQLKNHNLFSVYQIHSEDNIKKMMVPFFILKSVGSEAFEKYCIQMPEKEVSKILINFIIYDSDDDMFVEKEYELTFCKYGIMKERLDKIQLKRHDSNSYMSTLSFEYHDYFRLMFVYDLNDPIAKSNMLDVFKDSISNTSFVRFFVTFMKVGGFQVTNVYRDGSNYLVKDMEGNTEVLDDMTDRFLNLCALSWIMFVLFIKTGVCVIFNLDVNLDSKTTDNLIALFSATEEAGRNPAQLIFSSTKNGYPLSQEQIMTVSKQNGYEGLTCQWQNYL